MRANCYKCKGSFQRERLWEIHLTSDTNCFLCPECGKIWTKIYNRDKGKRDTNHWNNAWEEFVHGKVKRKFNPSLRGSA